MSNQQNTSPLDSGSLLLPAQPAGTIDRRYRKDDSEPLSPRHWQVVCLSLAGKSTEEVADLTGYSKYQIRWILRQEKAQEMRQVLMQDYEDEFKALMPKTIGAIRRALDSEDLEAQLEGAKLQLKYTKGLETKGSGNPTIVNNITAEDVVFQILNGGLPKDA